jgi:hypothetical protein
MAGGLQEQFALAFGGGMRFAGQKLSVKVGDLLALVRLSRQRGAVGGFAFPEQQLVRLALDPLAGLEAERFCGRAPPAAGRLAAGFGGLDVVVDSVRGLGVIDVLPDVVQM